MKIQLRSLALVLALSALTSACNSEQVAQVSKTKPRNNNYPTLPPATNGDDDPNDQDDKKVPADPAASGFVPLWFIPLTVAPTNHQFSVEVCNNLKDDDADGITDEADCFKSSWVLSKVEKNLTRDQLNAIEHACVYSIEFRNGATPKGRYHFAVTHDEASGAAETALLRGFDIAGLGVVGNVDRVVVKTTRLGYARCGLRASTTTTTSWSHHIHDLEARRDLVRSPTSANLASTFQISYINKDGTLDDTWTQVYWNGAAKAYEYSENQSDRQWRVIQLDSWLD